MKTINKDSWFMTAGNPWRFDCSKDFIICLWKNFENMVELPTASSGSGGFRIVKQF